MKEKLQDRYRELDKEAGKYNHPEFDKVYEIIDNMVKDWHDVGDNGNLTEPLVTGSIIDEALKEAGFADDDTFVSDFKKYREIEQEAREIQMRGIRLAMRKVQNSISFDKAMEIAGFSKGKELQSVLDNVIIDAKRENPYFPCGKPFEDLVKGDEEIDKLLGVKGYKIDSHLLAYYNELTKHKVDVLLGKIGIGITGLFMLLDGMSDFLKENTEKPIQIQNKIIDCLDSLNKLPGCGQVIQILFLQGVIEWFGHCDIDENGKGYNEAQTLCNWVYERLLDVCLYYFMFFKKDENSKPLDIYLADTEIGRAWIEYNEKTSEKDNTITKQPGKARDANSQDGHSFDAKIVSDIYKFCIETSVFTNVIKEIDFINCVAGAAFLTIYNEPETSKIKLKRIMHLLRYIMGKDWGRQAALSIGGTVTVLTRGTVSVDWAGELEERKKELKSHKHHSITH